MVIAQFSSVTHGSAASTAARDQPLSTRPMVAAIRKNRKFTSKVASASASTGGGSVHKPSATNCAEPAKTTALMKAVSPKLRPACSASAPNTKP